ncbi:glycoside hydrolase family 3 protein [Auriscalpium vulgare]|uniref:Glycoside hydrolase family 3 protein n=1 Tax=Auriscalpium vulgare TaxID=40419 RepID=A0ACB8RCB2_9AGAM|nr:glycoside hydrolase family 3 protein [Auriscalpium vulgare]
MHSPLVFLSLICSALAASSHVSPFSSSAPASSIGSSASTASAVTSTTLTSSSTASGPASSATSGAPSASSSTPSSGVSLTSSSLSSSISASSSSATSSVVITTTAAPISVSSSTSPTGPLTEPLPTPIPISSFTFAPFPSPSAVPPVPGVYPATNPKSPPPVESPGVVPDFAPAWTAAYLKAKAKIAEFSLEQKVNLTTGVGWMNGLCVGNIPPVGDFPGLCLEDSPLGVRFADFATAFPAGINSAATWRRSLFRARGLAMGQEHVGKGVNVALGPMMNMGRIAQGGRNWEGFGADPYLAGEAAYETILGMQSAGVQACAKHYINNEQENRRTQSSSNVDDRTQHEIYVAPFLRSVMAGVASVMCSYNLVNDTYACENDVTLNHILKHQIGFQGYVMSDWSAQHSTVSAIEGLDMTMPGDITFDSGTSYFGANLTAYVRNGTIPEARVDDMATRILAAWYLLGQDAPSFPKTNFNAFEPLDLATNQHVDVQDDHDKLVREIGGASTVLLKNVGGALPLKKPRRIVLVGSDAAPAHIMGPNAFADQGGTDGILAMGWGSGTAQFSYLISPYEAIQARARKDRTTFSWFFDDFNLAGAANAVIQQDVAIVFVQSDSGEGYITVDGNSGDRKNLTAWHNGDALVSAVAAHNNNTVVVVHSVGPLIVEPWINHPNVTAVLWAGLGGTETGHAITDVLYGAVNPSGRLPYTIAKNPADYPAQLITGGTGNQILNITYSEGLFIDYRHFDAANIEPRFEFGFGLSYTSFEYSGVSVTKVFGPDEDTKLEANWAASKPGPTDVGASTALWLHRPAYSVCFEIRNTGDVTGTEIPQLYVNHPASAGEPPAVLRGFTDVSLKPGEAKKVTLTLSRYDLSVWDVVSQSWRRPEGTIRLTVGASSRDERLKSKIEQ